MTSLTTQNQYNEDNRGDGHNDADANPSTPLRQLKTENDVREATRTCTHKFCAQICRHVPKSRLTPNPDSYPSNRDLNHQSHAGLVAT